MEAKKTALVMADGYEVQGGIEELQKHYDEAKVVDHFKTGALLAWLEERYYETAASKIRSLKQEYDRLVEVSNSETSQIFKTMIPSDTDIASFLSDVLGIKAAKSKDRASGREAEKREILRKKTDDEGILSKAALTAFTQEDMAELLDAGEKEIYLCGREFEIPMRVEGVKYVGILGTPTVHIAAATRKDIKKQGISLSGVTIDYLEDELENFLETIQNVMNCELTDNVEPDFLVLYEISGGKSVIKESIRQAAEEAENRLIARMEKKINRRMERLEDVQEQYELICEERDAKPVEPKPTLAEVQQALENGHERIVKDFTGKLAEKLVSKARYETLHFDLLRGSDYLLDNANDLDDVSDQIQRKFIAQYNKRDMEGIVQAFLRTIRRGVEQLQAMAAEKGEKDVA